MQAFSIVFSLTIVLLTEVQNHCEGVRIKPNTIADNCYRNKTDMKESRKLELLDLQLINFFYTESKAENYTPATSDIKYIIL